MKRLFIQTFALFLLCANLFGQDFSSEFPYAGTTYAYKISPTSDSSIFNLQIESLKSRYQGLKIYQSLIKADFTQPYRWHIVIQGAAQQGRDKWQKVSESYLETVFDQAAQQVYHTAHGAMSQYAESMLEESFMGDWDELNREQAIASAVEYFIMNYNKALAKHEAWGELETEETILANQLMAERQAAREELIASILAKRQRIASAILPTAAIESASQASWKDEPWQFPLVKQFIVDDEIYFLEVDDYLDNIFDDKNIKIRYYNEKDNQSELIYVSRLRIADSLKEKGAIDVYIHLAENQSYKWKIYPDSFLKCSIDIAQGKISYCTAGKIHGHRGDVSQAEFVEYVAPMSKEEMLIAAARYFVKQCPQALLITHR